MLEHDKLTAALKRLGVAPALAAAVANDPQAVAKISAAASIGQHAVKALVAALKDEPGDGIVGAWPEDDPPWAGDEVPEWAKQLHSRLMALEAGAGPAATKSGSRDGFGRTRRAARKGAEPREVIHLDGSRSRRRGLG